MPYASLASRAPKSEHTEHALVFVVSVSRDADSPSQWKLKVRAVAGKFN